MGSECRTSMDVVCRGLHSECVHAHRDVCMFTLLQKYLLGLVLILVAVVIAGSSSVCGVTSITVSRKSVTHYPQTRSILVVVVIVNRDADNDDVEDK